MKFIIALVIASLVLSAMTAWFALDRRSVTPPDTIGCGGSGLGASGQDSLSLDEMDGKPRCPNSRSPNTTEVVASESEAPPRDETQHPFSTPEPELEDRSVLPSEAAEPWLAEMPLGESLGAYREPDRHVPPAALPPVDKAARDSLFFDILRRTTSPPKRGVGS